MTNKPPRFPGATSSADSPADTELHGYSPPTPTPRIPLEIIIIQSKPSTVVPLEAQDKAAPRMTRTVVATSPILRPTRSIIRPKPRQCLMENQGKSEKNSNLIYRFQFTLPSWPTMAPTNMAYDRRDFMSALNTSGP